MLNEKLLNLLKILGHVLVTIILLIPSMVAPSFMLADYVGFDLMYLISTTSCVLAIAYAFMAFGEKMGVRWEIILN